MAASDRLSRTWSRNEQAIPPRCTPGLPPAPHLGVLAMKFAAWRQTDGRSLFPDNWSPHAEQMLGRQTGSSYLVRPVRARSERVRGRSGEEDS